MYYVLSEATVIRPRPRKRECDDTKVKERTQTTTFAKRPIAHRLEVDFDKTKGDVGKEEEKREESQKRGSS
jgi:hypothetical protein